ncbi:response regulator [Granulicella sp. 5B5]|uniref:response regulator n=1 Tax=Granulicella sp. 5B5 TaxID=1617967 RepID=UPI0015F5CEA7|nr:response regulator [Granulicella sp. 5B5]QMV18662.1 response regulator [Granulicella sp. 5B5]
MSEQNAVETPSYNAAEDFDGASYGDGDYNNAEFDSGDSDGPPAPGTGQSKSSRRRRRKRKNKLAGDSAPAADGASAAAPVVMEGESLALAASAAPQSNNQASNPTNNQPRKQANNQQGQQNGQPQGQGGKRWKKKFRDRERRPGGGGGRNENPGNDFRADNNNGSNGSGYNGGYRQNSLPDNFGNQINGFKRKNKGGQQKDRGFVGPMDHSYRDASADFNGAPPSTIQLHGSGRRGGHRHHGDSQPIDHSMPRPVPIPEGAQTHIYFFIEELFFQAKIQETAKKLGVKVAFIKNDKDAVAELIDSEENRPALIVFDLNNANAKPMTLIPKLKSKLKKSASIIGFLSHLQGDLKAKATEAGCDVVMPRAAFSQNLPNLLRRYGVEEAEEINYNY